MNLGRSFICECDGNTFAAHIVQLYMILLFDPFAYVLHRHFLLCQLHVQSPTLLLQLCQSAALFSEGLFSLTDCAFLSLLLTAQFRAPVIHQLTFMA